MNKNSILTFCAIVFIAVVGGLVWLQSQDGKKTTPNSPVGVVLSDTVADERVEGCRSLRFTTSTPVVTANIQNEAATIMLVTVENPSNILPDHNCDISLQLLRVGLDSDIALNNTPIILSAQEEGKTTVLSRVDAQAFPVELRLALKGGLLLTPGQKRTVDIRLQLPGVKNFDQKKLQIWINN